ncbi:glycoside hydrolase [Nitrosomonas supralitoralis]|uniref:Glycoside hydrolase n=1 Tax=Nitrosomonas supralitoralis TaxID=2116706 RepID=A0A2P7NWW3_9PROT|nr:glycoside hydrolase [Nitrosomonas supralitoralis]PSJ17956.1 glycoside hydrolase [Nitrosomonas supralitoralis]
MSVNTQALLRVSFRTPFANERNNRTLISLALLWFCVWLILAPLGVVAATPNSSAVKWHPGHYYIIKGSRKNNTAYLSKVYSELDATPVLNGMMIRYFWADLEDSNGVYDFSSIDKRLAELTDRGKRLVIQVQTKSFNGRQVVPNYLKKTEYEGGEFYISNFGGNEIAGRNIKLWNPQVRDRLIALFKAMGERYNSHPNFEGIGMIETAMGQPMEPLTNEQVTAFYDNVIYVQKQMRLFFPNTMTIQEVNYPRSILATFVGSLKDVGTALSSPDTFLEQKSLLYQSTENDHNKGIYNYYSDYAGMIPMVPTIMSKNYKNTKSDGSGYVPTISQILAFARDTLNANYIFWTREKHYAQVLEVLNMSAQKNAPAGGLNPTCPAAYSSCVD